MLRRMVNHAVVGSILVLALGQLASADVVVRFADPSPNGKPGIFLLGRDGYLSASASRVTLETPDWKLEDCKMSMLRTRVKPDGTVPNGKVVFYDDRTAEVLRISFTNGRIDRDGFRAGVQTHGTVEYVLNGVAHQPDGQNPTSLPAFEFAFYNATQTAAARPTRLTSS